MATKNSTKTAGAVKGGVNGRYQFKMAALKKVAAGTGYSTSHGGVVEGERILVGYIHKPRGTGARMHSHRNERRHSLFTSLASARAFRHAITN